MGFADRAGKIAIPCNYYSVNAFERERAVVAKVVAGGKLAYGYIGPDGREETMTEFLTVNCEIDFLVLNNVKN